MKLFVYKKYLKIIIIKSNKKSDKKSYIATFFY